MSAQLWQSADGSFWDTEEEANAEDSRRAALSPEPDTPPARKLVYDFMALPYLVRNEIAARLGLTDADDAQVKQRDRERLTFQRAKERGQLGLLREAVDAIKPAAPDAPDIPDTPAKCEQCGDADHTTEQHRFHSFAAPDIEALRRLVFGARDEAFANAKRYSEPLSDYAYPLSSDYPAHRTEKLVALLSAISQLRERAERAERVKSPIEQELAESLMVIQGLRSSIEASRKVVEAARQFVETGGFVANGAAQIKAHHMLRLACLDFGPSDRGTDG